jgi:hypothetical protein
VPSCNPQFNIPHANYPNGLFCGRAPYINPDSFGQLGRLRGIAIVKRRVIAATAAGLLFAAYFAAPVVGLLFAACLSALAYLGSAPGQAAAPVPPWDTVRLVEEPIQPESDLPPLVALPDLSSVDRSLREPPGLARPRYCLLVFGTKATTRVWLVEDGDSLYVDRNANGDITEPGEVVTAKLAEQHDRILDEDKEVRYRSWRYEVGAITPADGSSRHSEFELSRYQTGEKPYEYVVSVLVNDAIPQYAGWAPLFTESRNTAPVIHFGGPLIPKPLRRETLHLGDERPEIHFCIGTPGLGKHSFAYVAETVPPRPLIEIMWPALSGQVKVQFVIAKRC